MSCKSDESPKSIRSKGSARSNSGKQTQENVKTFPGMFEATIFVHLQQALQQANPMPELYSSFSNQQQAHVMDACNEMCNQKKFFSLLTDRRYQSSRGIEMDFLHTIPASWTSNRIHARLLQACTKLSRYGKPATAFAIISQADNSFRSTQLEPQPRISLDSIPENGTVISEEPDLNWAVVVGEFSLCSSHSSVVDKLFQLEREVTFVQTCLEAIPKDSPPPDQLVTPNAIPQTFHPDGVWYTRLAAALLVLPPTANMQCVIHTLATHTHSLPCLAALARAHRLFFLSVPVQATCMVLDYIKTHESIAVLETDVTQLKTDVTQLKTDVSEIKADIRAIKEAVGSGGATQSASHVGAGEKRTYFTAAQTKPKKRRA